MTFSLEKYRLEKNLFVQFWDILCVHDNAIANESVGASWMIAYDGRGSLCANVRASERACVRACLNTCMRVYESVCSTDVKADPGLCVQVAAVMLFALTSCKIPVDRSLFVAANAIGEIPSPRNNGCFMKELHQVVSGREM